MKKNLSLVLVATIAVGFTSCTQKSSFTIDGTVAEEIKDSAYLVYISDANYNFSQIPDDTIYVKDKKFSFTSDIDEPRLLNLHAIFEGGELAPAYVDMILVPNETAKLKVCNGFYELDGSKFYNEWNNFKQMLADQRDLINPLIEKLNKADQEKDTATFNTLYEEYKQAAMKYNNSIPAYIKEHNDEEGAFIYICFGGGGAMQFADSISDNVRNGRFKKYIDTMVEREKKAQEEYEKREAESIERMKTTAEGMMFTDFEVEYDGKMQKLSDYVGKGKYVLVDFWASWCGPCREEIPNLINVYNKYKGDKFEVLGVATWDDPNDTKNAIEKLGIPYPQIMNAQRIGSDAYGIMGIPEIILFAPDGTIAKRGLRGEEIEIAVNKALGK